MIVEIESPSPVAAVTPVSAYAKPHPLCVLLRQLRQAAGLSLTQFQDRFDIPAVVVGAYERGDRVPPLLKLDAIFHCFGYRLVAHPIDDKAVQRVPDMIEGLRAIADQLETAIDGSFRFHEAGDLQRMTTDQ
jgi:transcriptional regulator with XRE-family HTH domain